MPENEKKIKPFTYDTKMAEKLLPTGINFEQPVREKAIKPFRYDRGMEKNLSTPVLPFVIVQEDSPKFAENAALWAKDMGMNDAERLIPSLEIAAEHFKRTGGDLKMFTEVPDRKVYGASLLNFSLALNRRICRVRDTEEGEDFRLYYGISVKIIGMEGQQYLYSGEVEDKKVKDVGWLKEVSHGLATIPRDKDEKTEFLRKVQMCIEAQNVPTEIIYSRAGWRNVPGYGWRYIHGTGMIGEMSPLVHISANKYKLDYVEERLGRAETFYAALGMMNICNNAVASTTLFLYVNAALLSTIFKMAGHSLNFVFGIVGVTNSRKTSLATAMAKVFDREELKTDAEFATATACGIEKTLGLYKDAPVLVDDFKPGVTRAQQNTMDEKLDQLLRFCGDGVEKKRMLDFGREREKPYFPIEGGCVITLEIVTGILSSLSRLFLVDINVDDVNNERLAYYQQERWILPTYIADFLSWVTPSFDAVISFVKKIYPQFQRQHSFTVAHYCNMYALLMTVAELIAKYAAERAYWPETEGQKFVAATESLLFSELKKMEAMLDNHDKAAVVREALATALKESRIVPAELNEETCKLRLPFYEDEKFYYIRTKELRRIVDDYCVRYHERLQIVNDDEMVSLLERKEWLEIAEQDGQRQRSRKLPAQRGNTLRYLYIRKGEVDEKGKNGCA